MSNSYISTHINQKKPEIQKVSNTGIGNEDTSKPSKQRNKKVTGDSILNGILERGFNKSDTVTAENLTGGTSNTIVQNLDQLLKENPDDLIIM